MKERMMRLLLEYLKDSRRSDREIAKSIGVSQPTITRTRHRLVKEGVIKEFTVIPDFTKMGYEIMAITFAKSKMILNPKEKEKATKLVLTNPNIIFVAGAQGMGKNGVMISIHKSFSDFCNFLTNLILETGGYMENHNTMLIPLGENIVKPLSLTYLGEQKET
jgi:DNA-binding Lrp family transcriptional regulator